jgi:hypothetical protein
VADGFDAKVGVLGGGEEFEFSHLA